MLSQSMGLPMLIQILIVTVLLVIVGALFSGLYYMVQDSGNSDRMAKALTWRIGLSLGLFALLMAAFATGLITPHPV